MMRRELTTEEEKAYAALARAARRLREAQERAERAAEANALLCSCGESLRLNHSEGESCQIQRT